MKKMQISKLLFMMIVVVIVGSILTGCTGGAGIASSWPGVLADPASETVYLALNTHVYAVNLANGAEKWRFPAKADNKISFFAPPVLSEDGQLIQGAYNHLIYSLNPQNGQQNWTFEQATDKFIGPALADGANFYVPNSNNTLYALNTNGNLRWNFSTTHALWAKPLTDGSRIFAASMDHYVYCLDPETGEQIWKTEDLGGAIVSSFAIDPQGVLYVGTIGADVAAVDSSNGKLLWQSPTKGWVWSKPIIQDETLFIADQDGNVFAMDSKNGAIRWEIRPDSGPSRGILSTPVVVDQTLYFASQAGILYAVNTATGAPVWNKTIGGKIYSDLILSGETILVAPLEFDAALLALDLQGNIRWTFTPAK